MNKFHACDECTTVNAAPLDPWEHDPTCRKWRADPTTFLTSPDIPPTIISNDILFIEAPASVLESELPHENINWVETQKTTFETRWDAIVALEQAVHTAKKNDYTGGKDPLANYRAAAALVGLTVEMGMLMRMMEKVQRLSVLLGGTERQVMDETLTDTCIDIAVLAKLIAIAEGE